MKTSLTQTSSTTPRNRVLAHALIGLALLAATLSIATQRDTQDAASLKGSIRIDGSSTVYPITEAVTEEFSHQAPRVNVTVGVSGTGGGFKRFCVGETAICDASRAITTSEIELAAANKVEFIELPIAYDALSIVVHPNNDWVKSISLAQVKAIYSAGGGKTWKEINPAWPDRAMKIFSPGTDSGTFDYFKEAVLGSDGKARADMSVSEDDNVLVMGVKGDRDAIGFFGLAYFEENKDKLRALPVVNATGAPVSPSASTVNDGSYPLARPLFIYVNAKAAIKPEVAAFVDFYLDKSEELLTEVGYVPLPTEIVSKVSANWKARRVGTQFVKDGKKIDGTFSKLYQ
ncbi:MAG: PstS family phosphate ABC transporter substrate-binding protein [Phycisphaerales bacterium]|nr:PstS family phosphate ABC transporter substrate-binding protein [Phycisphaerales bacterium]